MTIEIEHKTLPAAGQMSSQELDQDISRVLRRLCETGAVLAVAREMEKAVVVRDGPDGQSTRTAVVARVVAETLALKEWIANTSASEQTARITRYQITNAGRVALKSLLADAENRAQGLGMAEAPAGFDHSGATPVAENADTRRLRYNLAESPLSGLARRKDKDGQPFLTEALVTAGERLREDFELAQMGPRVTQNWESFLSGPSTAGGSNQPDLGSAGARQRVKNALTELGPGLGDVVLRCCCFLEGLETAEKRMGWSARSGKIVLRIALQRLKRHYEDNYGKHGPLIG